MLLWIPQKQAPFGWKKCGSMHNLRFMEQCTNFGAFIQAKFYLFYVCVNLFPPGCVCVYVLQRHSKSRLTCQSVEKEDDAQERSGREAGGQFNR